MKKVLLTGGSGFIGRNILPVLQKNYCVSAPTRSELDLRDTQAVYDYVKHGAFDAILHSANPNPVKNSTCDMNENMMEDCMRIYMNFYRARQYCGKLIYLGSGAEFGKHEEISLVSEESIGIRLPKDVYGFSKYIMNELARASDNVYNMRIFACYGPTDYKTKFITHAIHCCLQDKPITIRQNCIFDYLHVSDLGKIACWFIDNQPLYHDYNVSTANRISLREIANIVCEKMGSKHPVQILTEGWNKEYTACNSRLINEMGGYNFISLESGIEKQIQYEKEHMNSSNIW